MFEPKFTLTPKLLNNSTHIERLYGQLEGLRLPKKLELNLRERNLIQSSYVSNSIEGNPLSLPEVTNLLLGERVPVNRDEKEVTNYFGILSDLSDYVNTELSIELMLEIHKRLLTGVQDEIAGHIRNEKVVIGRYVDDGGTTSVRVKHEPPSHTADGISAQLLELFAWAKQATELPAPLKAGIFHHHFVYIHPFTDGNGRTCRLLVALLFLKDGYQINRYFVLDDYYDIDRYEYSNSLHTADFGDKTNWLEYFTDGVVFSLQSALDKAKRSSMQLNIEERLTKREAQVLEYAQTNRELTSNEIAEEFEVSRQQAHNLLNALVEKGFLEKKGSTKSSYYILR